jgi:hypothetical protein
MPFYCLWFSLVIIVAGEFYGESAETYSTQLQ